jgi:hypothetical protein
MVKVPYCSTYTPPPEEDEELPELLPDIMVKIPGLLLTDRPFTYTPPPVLPEISPLLIVKVPKELTYTPPP